MADGSTQGPVGVGAQLYCAPMFNPAEPDSDEALMLAFAAGSLADFDALYARHRLGLYAFIARLPGSQEMAVDDVFQETWLAVTRSRGSYRPTAKLRTWLYQIARNRVIDRLREKRPLLESELQGPGDDAYFESVPDGDAGAPDRRLEQADQQAAMARALAELPGVQREAFLLHMEGELPLDEIARLTGVNPETAKSRLRYAIAKLRAALRGMWP